MENINRNVHFRYLVFIVSLLYLASCVVNKRNKIDIEYNVPPGLSKEHKTIFFTRVEHGKKMYILNCQKCHIKNIDGKVTETVFTKAQLDAYTLRTKNKPHSKNLTIQKLDEPDFDAILFYLTYKK